MYMYYIHVLKPVNGWRWHVAWFNKPYKSHVQPFTGHRLLFKIKSRIISYTFLGSVNLILSHCYFERLRRSTTARDHVHNSQSERQISFERCLTDTGFDWLEFLVRHILATRAHQCAEQWPLVARVGPAVYTGARNVTSWNITFQIDNKTGWKARSLIACSNFRSFCFFFIQRQQQLSAALVRISKNGWRGPLYLLLRRTKSKKRGTIHKHTHTLKRLY